MIVGVPRKRAAAGGSLALLGVNSSYSGFSTTVAGFPQVPVTLGQVMIAAFAGEDAAASQSMVSGPAGWTELFRYNGVGGNRQITVWRKVAGAGDVGATSFLWTQSAAFPMLRLFAQYPASSVATLGSGNVLTATGTYDYFPTLGSSHQQIIAVAFGDHAQDSAWKLVQREWRTLQYNTGLRLGLWDSGGPIAAGETPGIDTTVGGAGSTGWVLQSLTI